MNLYQLSQEAVAMESLMEEWALAHDGDITKFPLIEELEELEGAKEDKALSLGVWHKNLVAEESAIKAEMDALMKRRKSLQNKADRIKDALQNFLIPGTKYSNARCVIGWRKSTSVNVLVEPASLPEEFQNVSVTANKTAIKDALMSGDEDAKVYGFLIHSNNIQIK